MPHSSLEEADAGPVWFTHSFGVAQADTRAVLDVKCATAAQDSLAAFVDEVVRHRTAPQA